MMTGYFGRKAQQAMELIQNLKNISGASAAAPAATAKPKPNNSGEFVPMIKVDRIFIMMGKRAWDREPLRMMSNMMSPVRVSFRSETRFAVGEEMHLQILLGHITLEMKARVTSALIVEGECRGELALDNGYFEREKIREFTKRYRSLEM
jgi:hypothetical protein